MDRSGRKHHAVCRFVIPYPTTKKEKAKWAKEYGLNAYWAGKHWGKRKTDAEYWHTLVHSELRRQGIEKRIIDPAEIVFYWDDRLDIDNHAAMGKMIVDALKGWLIADDSRRHLKGVHHLWHEENAIWVEVWEV